MDSEIHTHSVCGGGRGVRYLSVASASRDVVKLLVERCLELGT